MSAQVKKRFEEMTAYLGRDTKGLEKLKLLKDDVNVLRKNLAAAVELAEQADTLKVAARERADAAEAALPGMQLEIQSLQQQVANLQRELQRVTKVEEVEEILAAPYSVEERRQIRDAVFRLTKGLPHYPTNADSLNLAGREFGVVHIADVTPGWTPADLQLLGTFVAVCVMLEGGTCILGDTVLHCDREIHRRFGDSRTEVKHIQRWLRASLPLGDDTADSEHSSNISNNDLTEGAAYRIKTGGPIDIITKRRT